MSKKLYPVVLVILVIGIFALIFSHEAAQNNTEETQQASIEKPQLSQVEEADPIPDEIFKGFYSREGNNGKMAETTGNNIYAKFYPGNRIARLYIPYPYAKTVKPEAIKIAFDNAIKKSSGSAYIRDKFGVMEKEIMAHLDTFRWIENQVMYDCGKSEPCKVTFAENSMKVLKPGMVVGHTINYKLINID